MNEPIISPWIFYALNMVDNLRGGAIGIAALCLMALVFTPILLDTGCTMKHIKYLFVTFVISISLLIFVPNSQTITQMIIAQHVTVHNIEKAGELTDRAVDKIIEKIIKISNELDKSGRIVKANG
jgi:hypothetical protein